MAPEFLESDFGLPIQEFDDFRLLSRGKKGSEHDDDDDGDDDDDNDDADDDDGWWMMVDWRLVVITFLRGYTDK